jgi:hypothetical protein
MFQVLFSRAREVELYSVDIHQVPSAVLSNSRSHPTAASTIHTSREIPECGQGVLARIREAAYSEIERLKGCRLWRSRPREAIILRGFKYLYCYYKRTAIVDGSTNCDPGENHASNGLSISTEAGVKRHTKSENYQNL